MRPAHNADRALGGRAGREAVAYWRVSSAEQEQGYSLVAQETLLREFAQENQLTIVREFKDVETAKTAGRAEFGEMVSFLKRLREPRPILLVEKTDRLYRNLRDWVTLDELHLVIHFVKENATISPDSRSGEKLVHGIKVLMAKNYVENLGEEASKGMLEKARTGVWPSSAPVGYQNTMGPDGKRTITPDPATAPHIVELFRLYSTGNWSIKELTKHFKTLGLRTKRGRVLHTATVDRILHNPLYAGTFDWNGERYDGTYAPIITTSLYFRVQEMLRKRYGTRERHVTRDFAYKGLIHCELCGCLIVTETKKEKFSYLHCTQKRGPCPGPWVREERVTEQLAHLLQTISFPTEVLAWVTDALKDSHEDEQAEHQNLIDRTKTDLDRLQARLDTMYEDRLDARITTQQYDEKASQYRREQETARERLRILQESNAEYMNTGITIIELAGRLHEIFPQQEPLARRETLNLLVKTATLGHDGLKATLRSPFDLLQTTIATLKPGNGPDDTPDGSPDGNPKRGRRTRKTAPESTNGTPTSAPQNHLNVDQGRTFSVSGKWRGRRGSNPRPQA